VKPTRDGLSFLLLNFSLDKQRKVSRQAALAEAKKIFSNKNRF
jgi:hypothetical protein